MSKMIELSKGDRTRMVSEFEYSVIKDDMSGWEVNKAALELPKEVADRVLANTATMLQSMEAITGTQPGSILATSPKIPKIRKNSKQ